MVRDDVFVREGGLNGGDGVGFETAGKREV